MKGKHVAYKPNAEQLQAALEELVANPTTSTKGMSHLDRENGIMQMFADLYRLATHDGCIAAAWALEVLLEKFGNLETASVRETKG